MRPRIFYCTLILATYLFVCCCINLGPDYSRPDVKVDIPESYQYTPTVAQPLEIEDRWWTVFKDPEIDRLVEQALQNNWDIKQAAARVLEARAQFVQVRAGRSSFLF